jgi:hypothetical protein
MHRNIFFFFLMLCLVGKANTQFSLSFSRTILLTSSDGQVTVPTNKTWKIVNAVAGVGTVTTSTVDSHHCGGSCSGGSCSSFSCRYRSPLYTINGREFSRVFGCLSCGSTCNSQVNCPASHTYSYNIQDMEFNAPLWIPAGAQLEIFGTGVLFSIIEFDIQP